MFASAVAYPRGGRLLAGSRCLGAPLLQGAAARTVGISSGTNASPWLRPGSRGALQVAGAATWTVTLKSTGPRRKGLQETSDRLDITLVDVHPDASGQEVKSDKYTTPLLHHSKPIVVSPGIDGWIRTENPKEGWADKIKQPGAILLKKSDGMVYVDTIELERKDDKEGSTKFEFPVFSWIAREQGERVFFASPAYLPHDTPKPLQKYRASELDTLKCDDGKKRQGAERKYGYQVYNDLGDARPFLGGSKEYPYPRRLATNRGKPGENEPPPPKGESCAWLPYDDRFALRKEHDFKGGANQGLRMVALTLLDKVVDIIRRRYGESKWKVLTDYQDVIDLFGKQPYQPTSPEINPASSANIPGVSWKSVLAGDIDGDGDVDLADVKAFLMREEQKFLPLDLKLTSEQENLVLAKFLQCFEPDDRDDKEGQKRAQGKGDLTGAFPEPLVITRDVGRRDGNIWQSDAEMGRQMLAGINPCVLTALKSTPEQLGSAIRDEHIQGELPTGQTLASLVDAAKRGEKPRLYWVDYWGYTSVWDEPAEGNKPSLLEPDTRSPPLVHAGRALFYLKPSASDPNKDEALLPIAIELAHNDNHKRGSPLPTKGDVYSRAQLRDDKWVVWLLAKLVFRSLDSGYHQLISHWLRTHAVVEPFYIALRRNVSALHPVYKLMRPHFRYTLHINANARSSLVHKGSTIEAAFSPGEWAMRLSAKVYSSWRFTHQALPKDLELRGMVDAKGKPWCDYPYADDGLDVWRTFEAYFNAYLRLYYKDDAAVKADLELQNWWQEVKTKAHGDIMQFSAPQGKNAADPAAMEVECWGFAGPISSVQQLTQVLVTIAWLASAHHAAVNFGQYDFSSVLLNFSSKIRQPMPKPGSPEMQALVGSNQQQQAVLNYLAPFVLDHARVMVTVQLLSMHAMDEQTLEMPNQYLDERAQVLNKAFAAKLAELQQEFDRRNSKAAGCWTRTEGQESSVPYSLLTAPLGSGAYRRGGVPYSISI